MAMDVTTFDGGIFQHTKIALHFVNVLLRTIHNNKLTLQKHNAQQMIKAFTIAFCSGNNVVVVVVVDVPLHHHCLAASWSLVASTLGTHDCRDVMMVAGIFFLVCVMVRSTCVVAVV